MTDSPAPLPDAGHEDDELPGGTLPPPANLPPGWLSRWPWATFLLPFIVFMLVTSFEPTPPPASARIAAGEEGQSDRIGDGPLFVDDRSGWLPEIEYRHYPLIYTLKIILTLAVMIAVWPGYRTFPWRMSPLSVVVGVVGVVLWIALCHLRLEPVILGPLDRFLGSFIPGWEPDETPTVGILAMLGTGDRSAYNPLEEMAATPLLAWAFLGVRFFGLAMVVPMIEEFFLRGFLMRFVVHDMWWRVPFGHVNRTAVVVGTAVPMLMHPGELLAAFVWFSMVTWLMVRTKNIWDCVIAHAVTNFLLGVYVVTFNQWQLM